MFAIGDKEWPGLAKLLEEGGEVSQVIGKLIATAGERWHWDGSDLKAELEVELGDLQAAIAFVRKRNALDLEKIDRQAAYKLGLFEEWHARDNKPPRDPGASGSWETG